MITAVVGHRGTGKTELMKRLYSHLRDREVELLDLDAEIEKKIGKNIFELIMESGEPYFRELERQVFLECQQKATRETYVVLGAGYDMAAIPENVRVLWVRRKTDREGRIFLDRPRLDPALSPLEEFCRRADVREQNYARVADEIYDMPEGHFGNHHRALEIEKLILSHQMKNLGGTVTLLPSVFQRPQRWESFKSRFQNAGVELLELRDDFLTAEQIRQVMAELPEMPLLFSFRKDIESAHFWLTGEGRYVLDRARWVDWALELGPPEDVLAVCPASKVILSSHEKETRDILQRYENQVAHCKWAPDIENFEELIEGHRWQKEKPASRSFLPRSPEGRWYWYRCLQKGHQLLNFWRYDEGSALDQPTLFQWLSSVSGADSFAAVLGDPVAHSFTPLEHSDFFAKRNLSVFAVKIPRDEFAPSLAVLRELGLAYAAVTAPHKEPAASVCDSELRAVNTLYWNQKKQKWQGTSTDDQGFAELIEGVGMIAPLQNEIFVWGGGGTLEMVEKSLPRAVYFASRTGEPRAGSTLGEGQLPKIVVWAAPRQAETMWPPTEWKPAMVYDLNYKEDSMGREYSQRCGGTYQSGLVMFEGQAQGQRAFWIKCEAGE